MNNYLKTRIMEENRHQFLLGYDGEERRKFLENLAKEYPVTIDENTPMAIYMRNFTLQKNITNGNIDKITIAQLAREHFGFSLIYNILEQTLERYSTEILDSRADWLLTSVNRKSSLNSRKIQSVEELKLACKESCDFYKEYYNGYIKEKSDLPNIDTIRLPFIMPESIIEKIKNMLGNNSYFGIIIDKQEDLSINTIKVINGYVAGRINKDISMKIACEPDKWTTYYDINGNFIEYTHDYGEIELDDSNKKYIKKLKQERKNTIGN